MNIKLFSTIKKLLASVIAISFAMTLFMIPASFAQEIETASLCTLENPGQSCPIDPEAHLHLYNEGAGFADLTLPFDCEGESAGAPPAPFVSLDPKTCAIYECPSGGPVTLESVSHVEVIWHEGHEHGHEAAPEGRSFNRYPRYRW